MPGGNPQNHRGNPAGKVYALKAKRNMLASSKAKATVNGRLYVRGAVLSYKGGLRTQYAHTTMTATPISGHPSLYCVTLLFLKQCLHLMVF